MINFYFLLIFLCLGLSGASNASASTFYVSPQGDDSRSGTSPEDAWRTATKVNRVGFSAGDAILFEGGHTFAGPVKLGHADQGTAEAPIVVSSYRLEEAGPATIDGGEGRGIDIYNASGIHISHLKVIGSGADTNHASGIIVHTSREEGAHHIRIDHVEVSGFGKHGISIGAWKTRTGYKDVQITRCTSHDNRRTGIFSWGPWGAGIYAHSGISIGYCEAYNMKGGSGITLSSVNGGVVERTTAHDNGEEFSGAAGIWAWDSNDILFQFNESYRNRTTCVDGDGFDFDGGVTNSVMQYNYSHDNDAAGFLLAQYPGAPQAMRNIIIRYNISENDCRKKGYGAIHVWNGEITDRISQVQIYQNTIYLGSSSLDQPSAIAVASPTQSVAVRNNLFFTSGGEALVSVVPDQDEITFQNNAYWSGDAPFLVSWKGVSYNSLNAWLDAAVTQERLGEEILAVNADPMLVSPGGGGTLRNADDLSALSAYKLKPGSPLARRGLDLLGTFGIDPGDSGFFGDPISLTTRPAIGAHVSLTTL